MAAVATKPCLDNIRADTSGDPRAVRLLFDESTLTFAIDTTTSMDDVIGAVREQAVAVARGWHVPTPGRADRTIV